MEHKDFVIDEQGTHEVRENRTSRSRRPDRRSAPGRKKKKVESIFWYLIPFVLINMAIFFYMTARPDFTLVIEDPGNYKTVNLSVETSGRLKPSEFSIKLDDVEVSAEKEGKNLYHAVLDRNGTLEVKIGYKNGMTKTQYEHISTIDDQPPAIIGEELDVSVLTVSFEDAQSGVDMSTVSALDLNGNPVPPLDINEEELRAMFRAETDRLEIHVKDLCGNEATMT